jgi:hypothetical protein
MQENLERMRFPQMTYDDLWTYMNGFFVITSYYIG